MTYLPTNLINENYYYNYNNNKITIFKNCISNNCNCIDVFPDLDYQQSKTYSCELSSNNLDYTIFTDNFYYRKDFSSILIIFIILSFFILWCPLKIMMRFFKRFN